MRKILLNGQQHTTAACTVAELVAELKFPKGTVLIEHNGSALRPDEWATRAVATDDRIEVMRIVAGG